VTSARRFAGQPAVITGAPQAYRAWTGAHGGGAVNVSPVAGLRCDSPAGRGRR
jgi:hypothetical protein